ncbi:MAG: hypothetical protein HFJ34_04785 [Clostridia bacterium]|nr:hypothetical protein [Clostridia bacterium]
MNDFTIKDMSDLVYNILSKIKDNGQDNTETVLQSPTTESIFPCRLIHTPLESIMKTENAIPILKTFQVQIEHWASKQRECMEMANKTDLELRKKNLIRTNTSQILFDEVTKKYRLITSYEVRFNVLTNSFNFIR